MWSLINLSASQILKKEHHEISIAYRQTDMQAHWHIFWIQSNCVRDLLKRVNKSKLFTNPMLSSDKYKKVKTFDLLFFFHHKKKQRRREKKITRRKKKKHDFYFIN